jgi:hypothetical protein
MRSEIYFGCACIQVDPEVLHMAHMSAKRKERKSAKPRDADDAYGSGFESEDEHLYLKHQKPFRDVEINDTQGIHKGVLEVAMYISPDSYTQVLHECGFSENDLRSVPFRFTLVEAYQRLQRFNAWCKEMRKGDKAKASGPIQKPREITRMNILAFALTINLQTFRLSVDMDPTKTESQSYTNYFEVVLKQPGDRLLWVWYGDRSDTQFPGSGKKAGMLGFMPLVAIQSVSAVFSRREDRFIVAYRGPKKTRGQLILAPHPGDSHVRGRQELITALHRLVDMAHQLSKDDSGDDDDSSTAAQAAAPPLTLSRSDSRRMA